MRAERSYQSLCLQCFVMLLFCGSLLSASSFFQSWLLLFCIICWPLSDLCCPHCLIADYSESEAKRFHTFCCHVAMSLLQCHRKIRFACKAEKVQPLFEIDVLLDPCTAWWSAPVKLPAGRLFARAKRRIMRGKSDCSEVEACSIVLTASLSSPGSEFSQRAKRKATSNPKSPWWRGIAMTTQSSPP